MTTPTQTTQAKSCPWCGTDPLYQHYHDQIWGRPQYDDQELFAKLCLDGQQAGLSWITILRKQHSYYQAFDGFDPQIIAQYGEDKIAALLTDAGIVRNRLKIESIIRNARGYLAIQASGQSFRDFLWQFVGGEPLINHWAGMAAVPAETPASQAMSKALRKQGFNFVGPTICYAFMQAVGMVNDHLLGCPARQACIEGLAPAARL